MNRVFAIGNVGADPQYRTTASGKAVLNFSIAVDRVTRVQTAEGTVTQKVPDWFPVVVFGDSATHQHKYLQKGSKIAIEGSLRPRTYTDKANVEHRTFEIQAERIDWLDGIKATEQPASE